MKNVKNVHSVTSEENKASIEQVNSIKCVQSTISTARLSISRYLHRLSINVVVYHVSNGDD